MKFKLWQCLILCAASVISPNALSFYDAQRATGQITFKVQLKNEPCKISVNSSSVDKPLVDLGTVSNTVGSTGARIPIYFNFQQCDNSFSGVKSVKFNSDFGFAQNPGSDKGGPNEGFISTKNTKVKIFLYANRVGNDRFTERDVSMTPIPIGEEVLVCFAQAEVRSHKGDSSPASAGPFEGVAEFVITYN